MGRVEGKIALVTGAASGLGRATAILLAREGQTLTSFFDAFPVAAWQGQIDAVLDGSIDATMVYEDVWLAQLRNAAHTKILARLDD